MCTRNRSSRKEVGTMISEYEVARRLRIIENALQSKGFTAAAHVRERNVAVLPPNRSSSHDCDDLWERTADALIVDLNEDDLASPSFLEIALRRVTAHYGH
jgi:hypothetical protein